MAFVGKYTCHKLQVIIWQLKHWDPFPQLTGWLLPFKLSTKRFWYLVRLLKNLDFIIRHGEMRPTIWTDRLTITISKLLQLPNAVGKSFHASSDHWSQLLLAPSTEAVFESHHPVRLLSRSSAFRKRSNLMNSRIRLVFMSLTLLTSQCPLIRTYCSTLEFSWRSQRTDLATAHLFQLLWADANSGQGVVHQLLVDAARLPLFLPPFELLLPLLLRENPRGLHACSLAQPAGNVDLMYSTSNSELGMWDLVCHLDVLPIRIKLLQGLYNRVLYALCKT